MPISEDKYDKTVIHSVSEMRGFALDVRARGESIGLVPTMGALHEGHLSLVRRAAEENDVVIVSVFVNPIQFDNRNDFDAYPKDLENDAEAAFAAGAGFIFSPSAKEMYPEGFSTFVDMTGLSEKLCGASREAHFRGVLTVVNKLFGICIPSRAYFGEKDAQQLAIVQKMAAELNMNLDVIGCATVREQDGLAMSSRNARLSATERIAARCLYKALTEAKRLFDEGETDPKKITILMREIAGSEPLARIDYIELIDPVTFETPEKASQGDLLAIALYIGETRLIDNRRL
jgi:pantoate--beta-alanine ligase